MKKRFLLTVFAPLTCFGDYSPRGHTVEIRTCQQAPSMPLTTTLHVTVEGYPVNPLPY